jgi:hypothetical protein
MTKENQQCPNCGSSIPKSAIKCGFCGFEISKKEITGAKQVEQLQNALAVINNQQSSFLGDLDGSRSNQKRASIISTFSLPNDKENLLELFYFCDSNADAYSNLKQFGNPQIHTNRILHPAWSSKALMAYNKLKRFANEDDEIKELINTYKNKYHINASDMKQASIHQNHGNGKGVLFGLNKNGVILGVVLLLLCFPLCWLPFVMPQFKGE